MSGNCNYRNPFTHSGASQEQRLLAALVPSYSQVDERNYADLVLFAKEYARYLNYYNDATDAERHSKMDADGDWTVFMKMDVSVTLATLSKLDAKKSFAYFDFLINSISQADDSQLADIKKYYKAIFEFIYSLTYWLDEEWQHLPEGFDFAEYCGNMVQSRMNELFWKVQQYYLQSSAQGFISNELHVPANTPTDIFSIQQLQITPLSSVWDFTPTSIFTMPVEGSSEAQKIKYISQHSIFKGTIELFLKSLTGLTQKAGTELDKTLQLFPSHSPHYALYLTFIQLFKYSQTHLNDYTGRHLNFYYKNVLQLKNAPAQLDSVHLVMELAKQTDAHLLAKDTVFKASKDVDGIDIFYASTDDVVLNKGLVTNIKSVFTKKENIAGVDHLKIYAAPISNSDDGKGGAITAADQSWEPFGDPLKNDYARTGFAIAHSILYMKEGVRVINVTFNCGDVTSLKPYADDLKNWFKARLTGPKGWTDIPITASAVYASGQNQIIFQLKVDKDLPAVVPYSEKIHSAHYSTDLPVIEFIVNTSVVHHDPHLLMQVLHLSNITIHIDVQGVKDVSIQNELNALDAAKPFAMWGPEPHISSPFIIGSKEIFLKNNDAAVTAKVTLNWDKTDDLNFNTGDYNYTIDDWYFVNKKIRISYLKDGEWINVIGSYPTIFQHIHTQGEDGVWYHVPLKDTVDLNLPVFNNSYDFTANSPYVISSTSGYMKVELMGPTDFGHGDYVQRLTQASIAGGTVPPKPYTPTVKSFAIDYTATAGIDMSSFAFMPIISFGTIQQNLQLSLGGVFSITTFFPPILGIIEPAITGMNVHGNNGYFYHLHPFGHAARSGSFVNILPSFTDEGKIFIGIDQFKADQSIQILFQLSEGSANPLKDRQNIVWAYLSANNIWRNFDDKSVSDATNDFTQSGIIKFGFPHDATNINSLFAEQLFWISGTVQKDTDATCNIIQLYAQAVKVQFTDYLHNGNYFKNILPASTISKLVISDAAIKKTAQPYSSFGGRVIESDEQFHVRVSERLRHKNRGITMWDYEHIVLQNFTEIYKVKCINHTVIKLNVDNTESDNEMAPGHVVVVPVPDLRNKNAIDPLKPMTSIGTLTNINEFLKKIISPFVKLQVKNARFEEIQLDFRVKFTNDDGAFYHDVLNDEIVEFLSPWAFDAGTDLSFGGSVYKSVLLNFVEERPYVDFVTCFKMYSWVDGLRSADIDEAIATSARSVLVSYGAVSGTASIQRHLIDYVNHDCNC